MVNYVVKKHKNENVLLVTHMDPIKIMLSEIMYLTPQALFELIITNGSLTIIKENNMKFFLSAINVMNTDRYNQN